jgi:hypothetical protein
MKLISIEGVVHLSFDQGSIAGPVPRAQQEPVPALIWLRQPSVCGEPAEVGRPTRRGWSNFGGLKLFINAETGAVPTGAQRELCRTWPNQTKITLPAIHFIQEVVPFACLLTTKRKLSREFVKPRSRLRSAARCLLRFPWRVGSVYDVRHQMHYRGRRKR